MIAAGPVVEGPVVEGPVLEGQVEGSVVERPVVEGPVAEGPCAEGWYARRGKRVADVIGAVLALVLLALPLAAAALLVRVRLGRGVVFRQIRAGRGGVPLTILKLRTMRHAAFPGEPDADRLDPLGHFLRASALDEVPQFLGVLKGEMSLVGPRPLPMAYLPLYSPRQAERLRVRPGLAGPAQAMGRNAVPWTMRLECDSRYAHRITASGDLRAVLGTLAILLRVRGVRAPGHATMPAFTGETSTWPSGHEQSRCEYHGTNH